MNHSNRISLRLGCFAAALLLAGLGQAPAATVSSSPLDGATGVSPAAPVVFTFSEPMDPDATAATFYSLSPFGFYYPTLAWNNGNTELTCTPTPAFPNNLIISWQVFGDDADGFPVSATGSFTTGTGSGGSGSGTNAITTFAVGKVHAWDQASAGAPAPDPTVPYFFNALTTLASNRTATAITLTLPTATVSNLTHNLAKPEDYYLLSSSTSSNAFEATFPQGTYTFFVSAAASNQTVQVVMPTAMTQPNPPHITNFLAAQSVNATQSFTLGWDAFAGGTSTDYVYVAVGDAWETPARGAPGALSGTATSVTIPANSLQPNSNYTATVGFYRSILVSNATYATSAYRGTHTQLSLNTGGAARPVITNVLWSGNSLSFDVITTVGQALTIVSSTNSALPLTQWPTLLTTNSPGTRVHVVDPRSATNRVMVYRARNGS